MIGFVREELSAAAALPTIRCKLSLRASSDRANPSYGRFALRDRAHTSGRRLCSRNIIACPTLNRTPIRLGLETIDFIGDCAARALVRWSAEDLARESAVSVATIRRAELADKETFMNAANDLAICRALEAASVEFIDENGGGPGRAPSQTVTRKITKMTWRAGEVTLLELSSLPILRLLVSRERALLVPAAD